jgi:hypothetical protein
MNKKNLVTTKWKIPLDSPNKNNHVYSKESFKGISKKLKGVKIFDKSRDSSRMGYPLKDMRSL